MIAVPPPLIGGVCKYPLFVFPRDCRCEELLKSTLQTKALRFGCGTDITLLKPSTFVFSSFVVLNCIPA